MTLHKRAMRYVADVEDGTLNSTERLYSVVYDRYFVPDVIGKNGSMHEVEVVKHKFNRKNLKEYLDAIKFTLPRRRGYMVLWFVIPNFEDAFDTFEEVRILAETKKGFVELSRFSKRDLEAKMK